MSVPAGDERLKGWIVVVVVLVVWAIVARVARLRSVCRMEEALKCMIGSSNKSREVFIRSRTVARGVIYYVFRQLVACKMFGSASQLRHSDACFATCPYTFANSGRHARPMMCLRPSMQALS
jgi:hypothetical protein